jgi:diguanylate cyclase (GGDEF)-like protein
MVGSVVAVMVLLASTILGFEQYGLPAVVFGFGLAYSGSLLYVARRWEDRAGSTRDWAHSGLQSMHIKLTATLLAVLVIDAAAYLTAVSDIGGDQAALATVLADVFVVVALLTLTLGLILPGVIGHATGQVSRTARDIAGTTLPALTTAMEALGRGELENARAGVDVVPVEVRTRDEMGAMARDFNRMLGAMQRVSVALDAARDQVQGHRDRLRTLAFTDPLTGLPNRVLFRRLVEDAVGEGRVCTVALVDIDAFKAVNDAAGRDAGDAILGVLGTRLSESLAGGSPVGRLGGDEFAVLLSGDGVEPLGVVGDLLRALRRPVRVGAGSSVTLTASAGIATATPGVSAIDVLRRADVALYAAKDLGGARSTVYTDEMGARAARRLALEQDLRGAQRRGELHVVYQPQVDLRSGTPCGVEALVRWTHPRRGPVGPAEFIPVAEQTGLVIDIDTFVLRTACADLARWRAAGLARALVVAVNVSGRELVDGALVTRVSHVLDEAGVPGDALEIEMTEGMAVEHPDAVLRTLTALRDLGVRVAIDDFGTGYSSFAALQRFGVDKLKIDRSFIAPIVSAAEPAPVIEAMIAMGHDLGLGVLMEGVETREQQDLLHRLGCDAVQGYRVSRPLDPEALARWLTGAVTP